MTVCEHGWWGSTWELFQTGEKGGILWCQKCGQQRSWRIRPRHSAKVGAKYEDPVEKIPLFVAGHLLAEMLERAA